jgi:sRNA-binding regulator protein Hfq
MTPTIGQHVKCFFRNGTLIEGIVEEWSNTGVSLCSISDQSLILILHPMEDLMMIKILADKSESLQSTEEPDQAPSLQDQIRTQLQNITPTEDPDLQKLSIAELKRLADQQDKQMITNKIRQHFPAGSQKPNYTTQSTVLAIQRTSRGKH